YRMRVDFIGLNKHFFKTLLAAKIYGKSDEFTANPLALAFGQYGEIEHISQRFDGIILMQHIDGESPYNAGFLFSGDRKKIFFLQQHLQMRPVWHRKVFHFKSLFKDPD